MFCFILLQRETTVPTLFLGKVNNIPGAKEAKGDIFEAN